MEDKGIHTEAFAHYQNKNSFCIREFSMAIKLVQDEDTCKYMLGYSIVNPKDKNYCKKIGRKISIGRANSENGISISDEYIKRVGSMQKALIDIISKIENNFVIDHNVYSKKDDILNRYGYVVLFRSILEKSIPSK